MMIEICSYGAVNKPSSALQPAAAPGEEAHRPLASHRHCSSHRQRNCRQPTSSVALQCLICKLADTAGSSFSRLAHENEDAVARSWQQRPRLIGFFRCVFSRLAVGRCPGVTDSRWAGSVWPPFGLKFRDRTKACLGSQAEDPEQTTKFFISSQCGGRLGTKVNNGGGSDQQTKYANGIYSENKPAG